MSLLVCLGGELIPVVGICPGTFKLLQHPQTQHGLYCNDGEWTLVTVSLREHATWQDQFLNKASFA